MFVRVNVSILAVQVAALTRRLNWESGKMKSWLLIGVFLLSASIAEAIALEMPPSAELQASTSLGYHTYDFPVGAWNQGRIPVKALRGEVVWQSWRIDLSTATTLQVLETLEKQIKAAGYRVIFACDWRECGGFDFRYALRVMSAPSMYVNVRDYRYLAAENDDGAVNVLVSRGRTGGYVQVTRIGTGSSPTSENDVPAISAVVAEKSLPPESVDIIAEIVEFGYAVVSNLNFETGTDELAAGGNDDLAQIATFMRRYPDAEIVLVGHTDFEGTLEINVALSKRRAEAVRDRLVSHYGVSGDRIGINGVGYLSPEASNLTEKGREQNRRVEAVLLKLK
ncbi:MAG: OmpA family protein [Aestuariivita sp.]|nr:OmpA family protein [Aestuariivita sp.]